MGGGGQRRTRWKKASKVLRKRGRQVRQIKSGQVGGGGRSDRLTVACCFCPSRWSVERPVNLVNSESNGPTEREKSHALSAPSPNNQSYDSTGISWDIHGKKTVLKILKIFHDFFGEKIISCLSRICASRFASQNFTCHAISWWCIIGLWRDYDPRRIVVDRQYLRWENDHSYLLRSLSTIQSGRRWCRGRNELLLNTSSHWRVPCRLKVIVSRLTYDYGWIWITWTRTHSLTCKEKSVRKIDHQNSYKVKVDST